MSERPRAVIIGGGLAGLSAAVRLARSGVIPTVLEKRPFLGGRAFSFEDPETGVEVDNGQHVFVGACTEFRQYVSDIGASGLVNLPRRLDTRVISGSRTARLKSSEYLPGPLANIPAVLGYTHLSIADRLRTLYGLARVRMARRLPGGPLERETFDSWLRRHAQTETTIKRFWNVIVLPALNDDISVVSADAGMMLFQTALFGAPENAAIGYSTVGLTKLASEPARVRIEQFGGEVNCDSDVKLIEFMGNRVSCVRKSDGQAAFGDVYISALPAAELLAVLPEDLVADRFFSPAATITTSPIVGVHIWYDRPVMTDTYVAVLDSPVQWVFNVSRMHSRDALDPATSPGDGQHVVISLSVAVARYGQGKSTRTVRRRNGTRISSRQRGAGHARTDRQDARCDIQGDTWRGPGPSASAHARAEFFPGRRLDSDRMAVDDGECREERQSGCRSCHFIPALDVSILSLMPCGTGISMSACVYWFLHLSHPNPSKNYAKRPR